MLLGEFFRCYGELWKHVIVLSARHL